MTKKYKELVKKIMNADIDKLIKIDAYDYYLNSVKFEEEPISKFDIDKERGIYTWTGKIGWQCVFPMKNLEYVKYFKTLKGAKRNFIKNYLEE